MFYHVFKGTKEKKTKIVQNTDFFKENIKNLYTGNIIFYVFLLGIRKNGRNMEKR